jgi:epoxyqueuosine reductase
VTPAEQTKFIREQALAAGFDLCGVAPADTYPELGRLPEWLSRGYAGEMNYLEDSRRANPQLVLKGARSVIVVALNYNTPPTSAQSASPSSEPPRAWISRYAWGDDYHDVMLPKLKSLVDQMRSQFAEPFDARAYVDTGPIIERIAAKYAGLGWLAKNTCLINQQLGSWLFLGVIVTTLALEPTLSPADSPPPDLCGSCTRCLDACPTQAFPEPYVLDARRCISYLTIELRGPIPDEFRSSMGSAVIGCDICQDVCPWNRKAPLTSIASFLPREIPELPAESARSSFPTPRSLFSPAVEWLANLSQEDFSRIFRGSAVKRAKWRGLVRNACVALGNSAVSPDSPAHAPACVDVLSLLDRLASCEDSLIASHARWAISRLTRAEVKSPVAD